MLWCSTELRALCKALYQYKHIYSELKIILSHIGSCFGVCVRGLLIIISNFSKDY